MYNYHMFVHDSILHLNKVFLAVASLVKLYVILYVQLSHPDAVSLLTPIKVTTLYCTL